MLKSLYLRSFSPMTRKLLRDLWLMRGQGFALAAVIGCGVAVFILMNGTYGSLVQARENYYANFKMADGWAPVRRAPNALIDHIKTIDGIRRAEGRISSGAILNVEGIIEPVTAKLVSLPKYGKPLVNDIFLRWGRYPDKENPDEVVVSEDFLDAHKLVKGDKISANIYGVKRELVVVGAGLSPEFVYSIPPGELVPNASRYAIMWMGREALDHAFNMDGAFNEAVFTIGRSVDIDMVLKAVDDVLEPYAGFGAYSRDDHMAHQFLESELDGLSTLGTILPTIFMLVAAFLLNIVLNRIVEQEREQVGLLKAFGYSGLSIAWHYSKFAGTLVCLGILGGFYFGGYMGEGMAAIYQDYYKFPVLEFDAPMHFYGLATLIAICSGALGVYTAVRGVLSLPPAVAMAPAVPTDYSKVRFRAGRLWDKLDQTSRMILRHIARWPLRAMLTCLGIALAMGMMVGAQTNNSAVDRMIDLQFDVVGRMDVTLYFTEAQNRTMRFDLMNLPGVLQVEEFRSVPVEIGAGHIKKLQGITGVVPEPRLSRLIDTNDKNISVPLSGLILSDELAKSLDVQAGGTVHLEMKSGSRRELDVGVNSLTSTFLGTPAYIELSALNDLMQDGDLISGAHLLVDENMMDALFRAIKGMPSILGISAQKSAKQSLQDSMDEVMGTMTYINTLFASLIAIGVVYSSARISFYERQREIASLRVMGFTRAEVNTVLLGELGLLTLVALPIGMAIGYGLAYYIAQSISSELFRIPISVTRWALGYASLVIIIASLASGLVVIRKAARLDLVAALKTKE